jgi:hypothetical protein
MAGRSPAERAEEGGLGMDQEEESIFPKRLGYRIPMAMLAMTGRFTGEDSAAIFVRRISIHLILEKS